MSTLVLEHPPLWVGVRDRRSAARSSEQRSRTAVRGGLTLDELITGVWEGLSACQAVRCPACGGAMQPARESGPRGVLGACNDCGSELG